MDPALKKLIVRCFLSLLLFPSRRLLLPSHQQQGWSCVQNVSMDPALNPLPPPPKKTKTKTKQTKKRFSGLVVKASASRAEDPRFESGLRRIFPGSSHTSDFKIGTPVAALPDAGRYRVSAGTDRPGVSILWLGEMESSFCNFCISVAACKIVRADASLRYTGMLLGR